MKLSRNYLLAGLLALSTAGQAQGTGAGNLPFVGGVNLATFGGAISGDDTATYRVSATAGQHLHVVLQTDNASNHFNIYAPGKGPGEEAMFTGSVDGNSYSGVVPVDGVYTVQVFLIRNAARRNESANYKLRAELKSRRKTAAPRNGKST